MSEGFRSLEHGTAERADLGSWLAGAALRFIASTALMTVLMVALATVQ